MSEYVEKFTQLVDQLNTYQPPADPLYFTLRFIDGLKHEIQSIVMVQCPSNLDFACVLALVQDEALQQAPMKVNHRLDYHKFVPRTTLPLPVPSRLDKSLGVPKAEDKRGVEAARITPTEDKLIVELEAFVTSTLRNGLTGINVQLHAMQEVWELFQGDETVPLDQPLPEEAPATLSMTISKEAMEGQEGPKTLKL